MARLARAMFQCYRAGIEALVWSALAPLELGRCLGRRARLNDIAERLGIADLHPKTGSTRVLIHSASAAEVRTAVPLVERLASELPECRVVISSSTKSGRQVAREACTGLANVDGAVLLPWDRPAAVASWLERTGFDGVVILETEIWPGLYAACATLGLPLMLASGRLPAREVWRYGLVRPLIADALERAAWIGVQDEYQRSSFARVGSPSERTTVGGDLKLSAALLAVDPLDAAWRLALADDRYLIVAGSTHAPEERMLGAAFERIRDTWPDARLIIGPRHVTRAPGLVRRLARTGLRVGCWSDGARRPGRWDILVLDHYGPLRALYQHADVIYVGGTMNRVGGHNVCEAAAAGRAVIVGPRVDQIRGVVEALDAADAIRRLPPSADPVGSLSETIHALFADPGARDALGRRAAAFVAARGDVAQTYAAKIAACVAERSLDATLR